MSVYRSKLSVLKTWRPEVYFDQFSIINSNTMTRIVLLFLLLLPCIAPAQDPDIDADEQAAFEDFFRSSDLEGETPVGLRGKNKRVSVPRGAVRLGCLCMDDTHSPARSTGACSGHGGVRHWLYRTLEGDTVRVLTARHEFHPHPLDSAERSALNRPPTPNRRQTTIGPAQQPVYVVLPAPAAPVAMPVGQNDTDWPEALGLGAGGALSLLAVRLLLGWADKQTPLIRDALHYLLRHRKRPPARKDGKNARPPRL